MLYDGACGICTRSARFLAERDGAGRLELLTLQDPRAAALLAAHGRDASRLDTMYVLADPGTPRERLLDRARGMIFSVAALGGAYRAIRLLGIVPRPLLDLAYDAFARARHRFGACGAQGACAVGGPPA